MATVTSATKITRALFDHLQQLRNEFTIVFQLNRYNPQDGGRKPYVRVNQSRNIADRLTMDNGGVYQYRGILQLMIVHSPNSEEWFLSEPQYLDLAQKIVDHFTSDTVLTNGGLTVRVYNMPTI